MVNDIRECFCH